MIGNWLKTVVLLGTLSGLLFVMGYLLGGTEGLTIAFIMALLINFVTYFFSDKIVLAMYGAKPLDKARNKMIYEMVEELCAEFRMPMPKLWYLPSSMANAFATGRSPAHASVAVTQGILDLLEEHELRGVLAHEISHVKNRDILIGTIAATIAATIGYVGTMLRWSLFLGGGRDREKSGGNIFGVIIMAVIMPLVATLLQLAVSRSREYLADESGAQCCRDPLALASALEKLQNGVKHDNMRTDSAAQASAASLFIVYPFSGSGLFSLFSTHPPIEKRIARLRAMAKKM